MLKPTCHHQEIEMLGVCLKPPPYLPIFSYGMHYRIKQATLTKRNIVAIPTLIENIEKETNKAAE